MKTKNIIVKSFCVMALIGGMTSCDDFLDREPLSQETPEEYFVQSSQLRDYCNQLYANVLPSHGQWDYGFFGQDNNTDNQVSTEADNKFTKDLWKVPQSEGSNWNFENIYRINFFFAQVLPKRASINGTKADINHYIGEMYFLRACAYFDKLQKFGDFPIVKSPLEPDKAALTEASKRQPCNEVARFIISDLDSAILNLSDENMATTRINKDVALLLKSRVALFEGTWLKYFKGTAFVPNGTDWPGAKMDYLKDYKYSSGSIDAEINWFFDQAIDAAGQVSESYKDKLTENTGKVQQSTSEAVNPWHEMFASEDLSSYPEVLLWRQYARGVQTHNVNAAASRGNYRIGLTRGLVQSFLMEDGSPIYTHGTYADGDGTYYQGDRSLAKVRANRDSRLSVFLKEPGQQNILYEKDNNEGTEAVMVEPYPSITLGDGERGYATGYALRKGGSFNRKQYGNGSGYTADVEYRASEALINYVEAYYERHGSLNDKAREYWKALRRRAHVSEDIDKTIAETDMSKEAENDWGAYSAGKLLTDKTLYNIRRERRCELYAEGLRYMDLIRWRAMDQLINTPYHIEGFHLWNSEMTAWYNDDKGKSQLIDDGTDNANVSSRTLSEYLRPFERNKKQNGYNGVTWMMAHYLNPIMIKQFQVTATQGADITTSTLYQNPYWPTVADQPATK